jgi:Flp pilus assembly protein TadG
MFPWGCLKSGWRSWRHDRSGSTAIEFSLVAIPFVIMMLGIIEIAILYTAGSLLEGSTAAAARMIRTGQLQQLNPADPEAVFRDALCANIRALVNCDNIQIEVVQLPDGFMDADDYAPQFDEDGNLIVRPFTMGTSSDVVLIRTAYRYPFLTPLLSPILGGASGSRLLMSTLVLETEPYDFAEEEAAGG